MSSGLDFANRKLYRAATHLNSFRVEIGKYMDTGPYKINPHPNAEKTFEVITMPPPDISIIAGEVLYQIRSALDYLAFALVKLNPFAIAAKDKWWKSCEFPLWSKPLAAGTTSLPQSKFERVLPGISARAFTFIESVQPYHRKKCAAANHLWLLGELSNIDKHRHLNIVITKLRKTEVAISESGKPKFSIATLNHGAKIESPQGYMQVKGSLLPLVTFDESAIAEASQIPVDYVLQTCLSTVQNTIVPEFVQFLK